MLKKIISSLSNKSSHWLESVSGKDRLFILELRKVTNFFDANELWEQQYSGNYGIIESKTQKPEYRLQYALNQHRISEPSMDKYGKQRRVKFAFNDVIVHIPKAIYFEDVRDNGKNLTELCQKFCDLHKKHLDNIRKNKEHPSYTITYHDQEDDKVIFQFGSSVFLPSTFDTQIAILQIQAPNGTWVDLPDWSFWQQSGEIKRPAGIYQKQELIILGHSYTNSSVCIPDCFPNKLASIHMNCIQQQAYGDGTILAKNCEITKKDDQTWFTFTPIKSTDSPIIIRWIDKNINSPSLHLAGYALFTNKRVTQWFMSLNANKLPCDFSDAVIYFQGVNNKLHARRHDQKVYTEVIFNNGMAEFEDYRLTEPPETLKSDYIGLLNLTMGANTALGEMKSNQSMIIGRSLPDTQSDISLDYFSDPQTIRPNENMSLGQIGLSRKHGLIKWQSSTNKIFVQQISANAPIHVLNVNNVGTISHKQTLAPNINTEIELDMSDRLVIGTYILGFQTSVSGGTII